MFKPPSGKGRRAAILLPFVLLFLLALAAPAWASSVGGLNITAGDTTVGETTYYTADFTATSGIQPGDEITMVFGTGYAVSQQATAKIVYDNESYTASVSWVSNEIVKVFAPAELTVGANGPVTVAVYGVTNPTRVDTYTIALRTTADADSETVTVTITPADPAKLEIDTDVLDEDGSKDGVQVTAGSTKDVTVKLTDKYGNEVAAPSNIEVKLTDTAGFESVVTVIYETYSSTTISWEVPEKVGTYTLTAEDVTEGASELMEADSVVVEVVADTPTKADITGPGYLDVGQEGSYTITLKDQYENIAQAGSGGLSLTLAASPSDGVTFDPNPVQVAEGESSSTFKFKSSNEGMYTITATDTGVSGTKDVAVGVTVLNSLAVSAPDSGEVGIASEITITLKDQFGKDFAAPQDGVKVDLATDSGGTFYDAPANGSPITVVEVAYNESSVTVYYVPGANAVGAHTLTFTTDKILDNGELVEADGVKTETVIDVGTAAALNITIDHGPIIAGERVPVTIWVEDQHGNEVPAPAGGRVVVLETDSTEGAFYATATATDPITEVSILEGTVSATVYYADTLSWTRNAFEEGYLSAYGLVPEAYSSTWAFRSEGVKGYSVPVAVYPAAAEDIILDLATQDVNAVPDSVWVQIESRIGDTDLIGVAKMLVGVVDQYGNPVPQDPQLTISVKDDSDAAFLMVDSTTLSGGEWAEDWDAGLVVTAPGTYTVSATAGGLNGAEAIVPFEEPQLEIEVLDVVAPDTRVPVEIRLTNLWAAWRDLTVDLSVADATYGAFYADKQSGEEISTVVISAYTDSVSVWFETDEPAGTVITLGANIAPLDLAASQEITVAGAAPAGYTELLRGWNIVSTPWALQDGKNTIDVILAKPEYVEQAWGYKDGQWYQVTTANPESMELRPLEAMYVKLKGASDATFWAKTGIGLLPPQRELPAGWNLVGNPADGEVGAMDALATVHGQWAIVISPDGVEDQEAWVYTAVGDPFGMHQEILEPYRGYWVYMRQPGTLTGLAFPPVQ